MDETTRPDGSGGICMDSNEAIRENTIENWINGFAALGDLDLRSCSRQMGSPLHQ
ncbi:MAG: hypothetical protein ACOYYI_01205 [Chloroflexota bacterium]